MYRFIKDLNCIGKFDVVIAGGGPAGICAAISAAMEGAKTLIIEKAGIIGGNLTVGHVGPTMGKYIKNTMADKINTLIKDGQDTRLGHDVEYTKVKLMELVDQYNISLYLNTSIADVIQEKNLIKGVVVSNQNGLCVVTGKVFIDATGDGILSYLAGERIEFGRDDGLVQPVSIMFTITGIDTSQELVCEDEEMDTKLKKGSYLQLCKDACATGELPESVNIVRLYKTVNEGERIVNATQANKINGLDLDDYTKAQIELRKQMLMVVEFLKKNVEGYENIKIKDSSDIVGIRESRRVVGHYILTAEDLIAGKIYTDTVVHRSKFSIDIHNPVGAGQSETDGCPYQTKEYDIPYRALVPLVNRNLYTAGRCISGTHRAHASYRVMNICMCTGEAAGAGAALCIKEKTTPAALDVKKLQSILIERGIKLFN